MKSFDRSPRAKKHPHYKHLKPLFDEIRKLDSDMVKVCLTFEDNLDVVDIPRPCVVVTRLSDSPHSARCTMWWANVGRSKPGNRKQILLIDCGWLPLTDEGRGRAVEKLKEELAGYINDGPP